MNDNPANELKPRKIIHIDMDCFYAAIEIRDNPALADKPVAVGGAASRRGVLCTCNYLARKYGIHSAMPTATALRRCKDLILLPVDMSKYKQVARNIHKIFKQYTNIVEPLALDEAFLDVSASDLHHGSATLIAEAIRAQIWQEERLTASAGVAANKFLAKIASGWKKPNGLFVIRPQEVNHFIKDLAVDQLWGVGKVTAKKLHHLQLKTCSDLQKLSLLELNQHFGTKLAQRLYEQCRGIDHRSVENNRIRKSLSVERTFAEDIAGFANCITIIEELYARLLTRISEAKTKTPIKNQMIKIKFHDFKQVTAEQSCDELNLESFLQLFRGYLNKNNKPIRLLGLGVNFRYDLKFKPEGQQQLNL